MRRTALVLALAAALLPAAPQAAPERPSSSAPSSIGADPAGLLGLGLPEAVGRLGLPESVYAVRGEEPWQDDVAFRYAEGFTLFLYDDRLWQLRFSAPYADPVYGLYVGDAADKAYSLMGEPYERGENELVYRMPYQGYPVRLRLDLKEGKLADIYLYRADF